MTVLSIEEEFALKETVIDGRPCRDFADNYQCLSELYHCFANFADNELVVYEGERLTYQENMEDAFTFFIFQPRKRSNTFV